MIRVIPERSRTENNTNIYCVTYAHITDVDVTLNYSPRFKMKSLCWTVLISLLPTCTLHPSLLERKGNSFGIMKLICKKFWK